MYVFSNTSVTFSEHSLESLNGGKEPISDLFLLHPWCLAPEILRAQTWPLCGDCVTLLENELNDF